MPAGAAAFDWGSPRPRRSGVGIGGRFDGWVWESGAHGMMISLVLRSTLRVRSRLEDDLVPRPIWYGLTGPAGILVRRDR
jgi:hypothetical protein